MLNSLRLGAAGIFVAGALSACASGAHNTSTAQVVPYDDLGKYNAFYGSNVVSEQRPYRSKCEDLHDQFQYQSCVDNEIDQSARDKDGYLDN